MVEKDLIPQKWQLKKLGDVCKLKNGFVFKSHKYENIGIPVIRISVIKEGIVSGQKAKVVKPNEEHMPNWTCFFVSLEKRQFTQMIDFHLLFTSLEKRHSKFNSYRSCTIFASLEK